MLSTRVSQSYMQKPAVDESIDSRIVSGDRQITSTIGRKRYQILGRSIDLVDSTGKDFGITPRKYLCNEIIFSIIGCYSKK